MKKIDWIVALLIVIGAIDWGLIGLLDFDLIGLIFGAIYLDRIIYILIGAAGIYRMIEWIKAKKIS